MPCNWLIPGVGCCSAQGPLIPKIPVGVVEFQAEVTGSDSSFSISGVKIGDTLEGVMTKCIGKDNAAELESKSSSSSLALSNSASGQISEMKSSSTGSVPGCRVTVTLPNSGGYLNSGPSIMAFGYTVTVEGGTDLRITDVHMNAEKWFSFTITSDIAKLLYKNITFNMEGGNAAFRFAGATESWLKIMPPKGRDKATISWEKVNDNNVRIVCDFCE